MVRAAHGNSPADLSRLAAAGEAIEESARAYYEATAEWDGAPPTASSSSDLLFDHRALEEIRIRPAPEARRVAEDEIAKVLLRDHAVPPS